jgi:hypothetical protein
MIGNPEVGKWTNRLLGHVTISALRRVSFENGIIGNFLPYALWPRRNIPKCDFAGTAGLLRRLRV